jgi:hypothetical protein
MWTFDIEFATQRRLLIFCVIINLKIIKMIIIFLERTKKLRGLSPRENYTGRERPPLVGKLVPTFTNRGCHVVCVTDPYGRILGFLNLSSHVFFQVALHLYSRGWVDRVPHPLLLRKFGSPGNRTRDLCICSQELWPLDHRGGLLERASS